MHNYMRSAARLLVGTIVVGVGSLGCGPKHLPPPELPPTEAPQFIAMLTPGVTIEDQQHRWIITGDTPVSPPFISDWPEDLTRGASPKLLELSSHFTAKGAQYCSIKVPNIDKPFYCVLALLPVFTTSSNPSAKRTYRMSVDDKNVEEARGGQVSVVYEPYPYTYRKIELDPKGHEYIADAPGEVASWILWISDVPFPGSARIADAAPAAAPPPAPGAAEHAKCNVDKDCAGDLVCEKGRCGHPHAAAPAGAK
jgi:hypothetical protein